MVLGCVWWRVQDASRSCERTNRDSMPSPDIVNDLGLFLISADTSTEPRGIWEIPSIRLGNTGQKTRNKEHPRWQQRGCSSWDGGGSGQGGEAESVDRRMGMWVASIASARFESLVP